MGFDKLVQKRMFFLIILMLLIFIYFGGIGNVGINKTVGWAWDITNWIFFVKNGLWLLFIIGYGILALQKRCTNKNLSILHLILIVLTFFAEDILNIDLRLIFILNLISIAVFFMNFVWAIRNRKLNP
ncbi:hypothetical protein WIW50_04825 [Flavobacteriaceae bacterium 3-367]